MRLQGTGVWHQEKHPDLLRQQGCNNGPEWNNDHVAIGMGATENRVTLLWIPGHSEIKGNNTSDKLAKLAVRENFTGPEPVVGVSRRLVTEEINSWLTEEHQKEWNMATGCRQAKALMGTMLNSKRAAELRKLGKNEVTALVEILIGHGNLGYHRHKIGLTNSPLCRLCGVDDETSAHILCHCPAIACKRLALTGSNCIRESDISAKSGSAVLSLWKEL